MDNAEESPGPAPQESNPAGPPSSDDARPHHEASADGPSALGRALRDVAPHLDLGWRLAATTAGPPVLGVLIDLWLETTPWFLLAGCVVGLTGAVLVLRRLQDSSA